MIDEVKKIKLEKLNNEQMQYEQTEENIKQKLNAMRRELDLLEKEQSNGMTMTEKFSFLEKWITRRAAYKKFKVQNKRFSKLPQLINNLKYKIDIESAIAEDKLETTGITESLKAVYNEIDFVKGAKTIYDLGMTPLEAVKFLEDNEVQPVLSEADKIEIVHPRDYSKKSSLICVHKTKYAPTANMIKSAKDSKVEYKEKITINGIEYEYSYRSERDTVHMAMNDEVSSHMNGSWEDCKYAVLIPFEDIPNEKIAGVNSVDTFSRGSVELSENTWILCPKNEVDRLKTFNSKVHILGYEGESVKGFSKPFLTQLGYRAEKVGTWDWQDAESSRKFLELMNKEGFKLTTHFYSCFYEDELMLMNMNETISQIKLLRDNNLITTPEDVENITSQLLEHSLRFETLYACFGRKSSIDKELIEPQAIKGNGKQVDVFLEKMKNNGFDISPAYQKVLKNVCKVSLPECNKDNIDEVFNIGADVLEEEQKAIDEFRTSLLVDTKEKKEKAFSKFMTTAICESVLHSKEKEFSKEKSNDER